MTDYKLDAVVDDFVGYCNGLFWIAGVVVFLGFKQELFAVDVNSAFGVDVCNSLFGASELHVAILSNRACFRTRNTDLDGVCCKRMAGNPGQNHRGKQFGNLLSSHLYWCSTLLL